MRAVTVATILGAFLALCAVAQAKIRGMAFSTGHDLYGYRQEYANRSLDNLIKTNVNYIHISAYAKMKTLTSRKATQETDDNSIRYIIRVMKRRGLKVFFKPVIEIENHIWRGFLSGTPHWFNHIYTPFIMKMARIAQQEGVDLFAVGSEYRNSEVKVASWIKVINKVKRVYTGKLTYVGNHDSYRDIKFWDHLTFISLSGYWRLLPPGTTVSPSFEKTKVLWARRAAQVEEWRRSKGLTHKQIIIAEAGWQSKGNASIFVYPWRWVVKAPVSLRDQRVMYEAFLSTFMPKSWCKGVILWNWELWPEAGLEPPSIKWYTPQNKPAEEVMTRWFKAYSGLP